MTGINEVLEVLKKFKEQYNKFDPLDQELIAVIPFIETTLLEKPAGDVEALKQQAYKDLKRSGFDEWERTHTIFDTLDYLNERGMLGGVQWQDMSTAPSDGSDVWVFGGRFKKPEIISADGDWWRTSGLNGTPKYWQPVIVPAAPEKGA